MKQLLLVCVLSIPAFADPKPTDAKLAQLVGNWDGGGTFTMNGKPIVYKMTYACQRTALGPAITCNALAVGKDLHLEENHMFAYDKATDTYHLFMTNDWGEAYDHAGKWTEPGKVVFQYDGTRGGKPIREVDTLTLKGDDLTLHVTFIENGKTVGDGAFNGKRSK